MRDAREVLRKTRCLICVGVGRSDGRHKANPSFHAITKVSSVLRVKAVFMMGIDKSIEEALEPFVDEHPRGLRLFRKRLLKIGFELGIIVFVLFSLHPVQSSGRNLRLGFGAPFSADQNSE